MTKITKFNFFKTFTHTSSLLNASGCVSEITEDSIHEIKINNKYVYYLDKDSIYTQAQISLCKRIFNSIPINNASIAYRKGLSYLNFFNPHIGGYYFLRLDISSFFHSISEELLRDTLSSYFEDDFIDNGRTQSIVDAVLNIVTYRVPSTSTNIRFRNKSVLPIGFHSSPVISNIIFRKLDLLIQEYCHKHNISYTRYADDLLFSSTKNSKFVHSTSFYHEMKYLLSIDGYKLNKLKTIKSEHTISLNGYVIGRDVETGSVRFWVSNKKIKIIKKIIHELSKKTSPQIILSKHFGFKINKKHFKYLPPKNTYIKQYCSDQLNNKLQGYRSYLLSLIKFDQKHNCIDANSLNKYKQLVSELNKKIR